RRIASRRGSSEQLAIGGRLVIPVGEPRGKLKVVEKRPDGFHEEDVLDVLFVPMTGRDSPASGNE
ncbi:MAG: hypothetical protein HC923_12915, partial [Myxococcales bacterium]|nr:hypothetical protein [Myxococcales bacterium]